MRARGSLLSKIIGLVTVVYFLIEIVTLLPFAYLYRQALMGDRQKALSECVSRAQQEFQSRSRADIAAATSFLPAGPISGFGTPDLDLLILDHHKKSYGFNLNHEIAEFDAQINPRVLARIEQFEKFGSYGDQQNDNFELFQIEQFSYQADQKAVVYAGIGLYDIEGQVFKLSLVSLAIGIVFVAVFGLMTVIYLRRKLLLPLDVIIQADNAGRRSDLGKALIPESEIPDDELGMVMHSRNRLQVQQKLYRERLAVRNQWLSKQREALKNWAAKLEELVQEGSAELLKVRESLLEKEKLAALGRLAANVAHEINNPLASIIGYTEELREITDECVDLFQEPQVTHFPESLKIIEDQAFRCKNILKRLLSLTRTDSLDFQAVNLAELINDTGRFVDPEAKRYEVSIEVEAIDSSLVIQSDRNAVIQVITNLLSNAVDAAHAAHASNAKSAGQVKLSVVVPKSSEALGLQHSKLNVLDCIAITVEDNGIGIPESERVKVFDEFYTTKPIGRGTGIGLAICQTLTDRLGGQILVGRSSMSGARFIVLLPKNGPKPDKQIPKAPSGLDDTDFITPS